MKEEKFHLKYAAILCTIKEFLKFHCKFGAYVPCKKNRTTKAHNQITIAGNQSQQEESQSGQSWRKSKSDVSAIYTSRNYFTQHWQGEYSLGVSYWINYVIVGLVFEFLLYIYPDTLTTSTLHDLYIYISVN